MANKSDMKSILIVGLIVVAGVLGYMLYEARQDSVEIELPGVKIETQ